MLGTTAACISQHTEAVGIIHHYTGVIFLSQLYDLVQFHNVSLHTENPIYSDQLDLVLFTLCKYLFQGLHVIVLILQSLGK